MSLNAAVSDAAANTVMFPVTGGVVVVLVGAAVLAVVATAEVVDELLESSLPQAAATTPDSATSTTSRDAGRLSVRFTAGTIVTNSRQVHQELSTRQTAAE